MATQHHDTPAQASAMPSDNEPYIIHGMSRIEALRSGLFSGGRRNSPHDDDERVVIRVEEGNNGQPDSRSAEQAADDRLAQALRSAGFI